MKAEFDRFKRFVREHDVSNASPEQVAGLLAEARHVQRVVDGFVTRLGQRASSLADAGSSAAAQEALRGSGDVGASQAKREAQRAEAADAVPEMGDALSEGDLSGEHADVLARAIRDLTPEQLDQLDTDALLALAGSVPVETFRRAVKRAVDDIRDDNGLKDAEQRRAASEFRHWFDQRSGMGKFSGTLDPERFEALITAIEEHATSLRNATNANGDDGPTNAGDLSDRSFPREAAEALVDLVCGSNQLHPRRAAVTVIVDHQTLMHGHHPGSIRQTGNGHDLTPEATARLCCDATLRKVTLDANGVPLNVGRAHRTATNAQWAALRAIYPTCAWHQCTAPISWCQAHHVTPWQNGGHTNLDQLVPLCNRHHHLVHEGRWRIQLLPDRRLHIVRPDGTHHATSCRPTRHSTGPYPDREPPPKRSRTRPKRAPSQMAMQC